MPSKKNVPKEEMKHSSSAKYLHVPNGQMLRGVQLQSGSGYQIPHSTDIHTFATRKRIKNKN